MSDFIDDFYDGNTFNHLFLETMLNDIPNLQKDYENFLIVFNDLTASINKKLYLRPINTTIPVREINIMIERMNTNSKFKISKYGLYRDCEDYLVKTDWFFKLPKEKQFKIRFDFYSNIVLAIHEAFFRA